MKYIKLFEARQTKAEIAKICKKYAIENWSINSEGLVDVDGGVDIMSRYFTRLPLNFGYVSGDFFCNDNELTSLHGSPREVGGNFDCVTNYLTSLEGCPQKVGRGFYCWNNQLTSLKGCPQEVGADFWCHGNQLTNLEYSPKSVNGSFYCYMNRLTTLRFAPEEIGGKAWVLPNPIADIPKKYLNREDIQFIVKEQPDWNLYRKDGTLRLDRFQEMIEWGKEQGKI